jgi:hypothetical protein
MGRLDQPMWEVVYMPSLLGRDVSCVVCSRADMFCRCLVVCPCCFRPLVLWFELKRTPREDPLSPLSPSLTAPPALLLVLVSNRRVRRASRNVAGLFLWK